MNEKQAEILRDLATHIIKTTGRPAITKEFQEYDDRIEITLKIMIRV